MKHSPNLSTTSPLVLLAIACYLVSASSPTSASSPRTSNTLRASALPQYVRKTYPLSVYLHASPPLEGAVGHRKDAFEAVRHLFTPLHHDIFNPNSEIAKNEKVTVAYQEIPDDSLPDTSSYIIGSNPTQLRPYPSSSEKVNTAEQDWYLAEHYFDESRELTSLCPRQRVSTVRRDDALEIEMPHICSVWNGFVSLMQSGVIEQPPKPLSLHKSLVLISNIPRVLRIKRHPKVTSTLFGKAASYNVAYVAMPYHRNHIRPGSRQTLNMLRLWMIALQEIRAEARKLHRDNGEDPDTSPVKIDITLLWSKSKMIDGFSNGDPLPDPILELALKLLACRLAGGIYYFGVASDESSQEYLDKLLNKAMFIIKDFHPGLPINQAAASFDHAYGTYKSDLKAMKQLAKEDDSEMEK